MIAVRRRAGFGGGGGILHIDQIEFFLVRLGRVRGRIDLGRKDGDGGFGVVAEIVIFFAAGEGWTARGERVAGGGTEFGGGGDFSGEAVGSRTFLAGFGDGGGFVGGGAFGRFLGWGVGLGPFDFLG